MIQAALDTKFRWCWHRRVNFKALPRFAAPLILFACNNETPKPDPSAAATASAKAVSAQASAPEQKSASAALPFVPKAPEGPPACKAGEKKVWASGVNKLTGLSVSELPDGRVAVHFAAPELAVTPGQAAVFYRDDQVLGGGFLAA